MTRDPLWTWDNDDPHHQYAAYIWPFFMQQEATDDSVFEAWVAIESTSGPREVDEALDDVFGFSDHFHDFAVRNLDADLPGTPLQPAYWDQAANFPRNVYPRMTNLGIIALDRIPTTDVDIRPLQAQYDWFAVNSEVGEITLDFSSLSPAEDLDFDLVVEIDNDKWKRIEVPGQEISFCRDVPADKVTELFVILSDHEWNRLQPPAAGSYEIEAEGECNLPLRYTGTFSGSKEGPQEPEFSGPTETWTATGVVLERSVRTNFEEGAFQGYNVTDGQITITVSGGSPCSFSGSGTFDLSPGPPQTGTGGHLDLEVSPQDGGSRRYEVFVAGGPHNFPATITCEGSDPVITTWGGAYEWRTGAEFFETQPGDLVVGTYDPPRGNSGDDFRFDWNLTPEYPPE
jgi:hypothetical protein